MSDRNIRWGELKKASDDKGPYKLHTIECDGKEMDCQAIEGFGVQSNAIPGSQCLVLVPDGDEGKAVCIIMPPPEKRVDQQKEGEVTLKNHTTGNSIQHQANKDTVHTSHGNIIMNSDGEIHLN